jgi:hypothetical protein
MMNCVGYWKDVVVPYFKVLEILKTTTRPHSHDSRSQFQDLNPGPTKFDSRMIMT